MKIVLLAGLNLTAAPGKRWTQAAFMHVGCNHNDGLPTSAHSQEGSNRSASPGPSAAAHIERPSIATESILQRVWSSSDTKRIKIDHRTSHWVGFREMSRFGRLGSYNGSE